MYGIIGNCIERKLNGKRGREKEYADMGKEPSLHSHEHCIHCRAVVVVASVEHHKRGVVDSPMPLREAFRSESTK